MEGIGKDRKLFPIGEASFLLKKSTPVPDLQAMLFHPIHSSGKKNLPLILFMNFPIQ